MPQQPSLSFFDNANEQPDFTVVLRGYDREQVTNEVQRLKALINQKEVERSEAERRMTDAQRRVRQADPVRSRHQG